MRMPAITLTLLVAAVNAAPVEQPIDDAVEELRYRVLLDDREIGYHRYEFKEEGGERSVSSNARFDVKFLFFNAYSYRHSLTSRWRGNCITSLEAQTDANGSLTRLEGQRGDGRFALSKDDKTAVLPDCIMDFAYWDPSILEQDRLLNPQTGEYVDVDIEALGEQQIRVGGSDRQAQAWRINARDRVIDLWYSLDGEQWLALESPAKGGRTLRYELTG